MDKTSQAPIVDTLAFATELKEVGVPEKHAERHADLLDRTLSNSVVTRRDLERLEHRLMVAFGLMEAGAIGILATLIKLF